MSEFKDALYSMKLGERITSGDKGTYGFDWIITRVPGGYIYTAENAAGDAAESAAVSARNAAWDTAMSPASVFVPYDN